jgi:hypothetical protein
MASFDDEVDSGRRIDQDFAKEDYRFRAKIISSEYKEKITSLINQYDFSQSCKIQLANIINVAFDPNAVLARNESIEPRKIQLEIAMNLSIVAMDESDVQNPGLLNVMNAISDAFGDFVSRSVGGKEIDNIRKQEIHSHQSYSGLPSEQPIQQGGRGLRLPWRDH